MVDLLEAEREKWCKEVEADNVKIEKSEKDMQTKTAQAFRSMELSKRVIELHHQLSHTLLKAGAINEQVPLDAAFLRRVEEHKKALAEQQAASVGKKKVLQALATAVVQHFEKPPLQPPAEDRFVEDEAIPVEDPLVQDEAIAVV
jgi:hypothetical protein